MTTMLERRKATDERIFRAALIEFGKNGYANTTLSNIAKSSGITPGLIVQNFGSKEDLYRKIAVSIVNRIQDELKSFSSTWDLRCKSIVENTIKMLKTDPDTILHIKFYVSLMTSLDTPDDVLDELFSIYHKSPVDRIITEGQNRMEIIDGDPYVIHTMFWMNMQNTICYCYDHSLDYPPTEWFLQLIRRR